MDAIGGAGPGLLGAGAAVSASSGRGVDRRIAREKPAGSTPRIASDPGGHNLPDEEPGMEAGRPSPGIQSGVTIGWADVPTPARPVITNHKGRLGKDRPMVSVTVRLAAS